MKKSREESLEKFQKQLREKYPRKSFWRNTHFLQECVKETLKYGGIS